MSFSMTKTTLLAALAISACTAETRVTCADAGANTPPVVGGGSGGSGSVAPVVGGGSGGSSDQTGQNGQNGQTGQDWHFKPVTSIKVRVQGNLPAWDAEHQAYVSTFGSNFDEKYRGVLDTVNMASVEGAFKYVQSECINYYDVKGLNCQRKNNVQYVVFYETTVAQPRPALAKYQRGLNDSIIEHCPYIPMDGGQCTPTNGVLPKVCDEYTGANGSPKLGFCIGGRLYDQDYLAPYPDTYWYSFPNSCPSQIWSKKTAECRAADAGGLCPFGQTPDGVNCTFSFKLLGWVKLDDVVGITSMVNPKTNTTYANYGEFCQAGGIEYKVKTDNQQLTVEETIPFWQNPASREANSARAAKLVQVYNDLLAKNATTSDGGIMKPLPTSDSLTEKNPPCYFNNVLCATSSYGCRRHSYAQICDVCTAKDSGCEVAPKGFTFPQL